jgi:hypothetical protein
MTALISWLLEEDDPGVCYLALQDLDAAAASHPTITFCLNATRAVVGILNSVHLA